MTMAIETHGLAKTYGRVRALDGMDLEVAQGEVVGLLGPNGAGKTTAVRILATLARPDEGRAAVLGHDVVRFPDAVRPRIGLAGQYAAVDELLSGRENLVMVGRLLGLGRRAARRRADELLETFGLTDAATKAAKTYSGGMRRRLDLAASLVGRPQVLFLDEPTTGLDPRSRLGLWDLILELVREGTTVLLTTQYLEEADRLADRIVVIDHGRVIAAGTPAELKARIGGQIVEVGTASKELLSLASAVLTEVTGEAGEVARDGYVVKAPVSDPAHLSAIIRGLDARGVAVAHLALRDPGLDEVFLTLTGHPGSDAQTDEPAERRTA